MALKKKDLIWRLRDLDENDEVYVDEEDGALRGPQGKLIADDAEMAQSFDEDEDDFEDDKDDFEDDEDDESPDPKEI